MLEQKCDLDCSFCNEISGYEHNNLFLEYFQEYDDIDNRLILATDNFCVMPSIGPLTEGHLLILPKKHYISYAHIPVAIYSELKQVKMVTKILLQDVYCRPVFFEHGPMSKTLRGGCCYDHAHMHAMPLEVDIKDEFQNFGFTPRKIDKLEELIQQKNRNMPYVFFENQYGEKFVCDAPIIESQFIRKLLAVKAEKRENIFWQQNLNIGLVISSLRVLKSALNNHERRTNKWLQGVT